MGLRRSAAVLAGFAAAALSAGAAATRPSAAAAHQLVLKTPGIGVLAPGATLAASATYTLGTNGACPISFAGALESNSGLEDAAKLDLDPTQPCSEDETQPSGSPWTLKLGAARTVAITGIKTLVVDRAEAPHCVFEAARAEGRLRTLRPLEGTVEVAMHPNKRLSSPRCPLTQRFTLVLERLLARNEATSAFEAVEGEII
jgi:hypothetical protein